MLQISPKVIFAIVGLFLVFAAVQFSRESMGAGTAQKKWLDEPSGEELGDPEIEPLCEELAAGADVIYQVDAIADVDNDSQVDTDLDDGDGWDQNRSSMEWEVELLWDMFFNDDNAKPTDPRRNNFGLYATHVVDAVLLFQNTETDIGGRLPMHRNVHLLIAWLIAKESSVTNGVTGKRGEVGMMQIMPNNRAALAGYHPEKVKINPKLSIMLGVRWLAYNTTECPNVNTLDPEWDDWDWSGPLSVYAGGPNAKRKNGTCKSFTIAEERIRRTVMYRSRIDHERISGNLAI